MMVLLASFSVKQFAEVPLQRMMLILSHLVSKSFLRFIFSSKSCSFLVFVSVSCFWKDCNIGCVTSLISLIP